MFPPNAQRNEYTMYVDTATLYFEAGKIVNKSIRCAALDVMSGASIIAIAIHKIFVIYSLFYHIFPIQSCYKLAGSNGF